MTFIGSILDNVQWTLGIACLVTVNQSLVNVKFTLLHLVVNVRNQKKNLLNGLLVGKQGFAPFSINYTRGKKNNF